MVPKITDFLLSRAEQVAEDAVKMQLDVKVYQEIRAHLPRLFPAPDKIILWPTDACEVLFVYMIKPKEQAEALRMAISLAFAISKDGWYGELQKEDNTFSVFSACTINNHCVLIKLIGANFEDYEFNVEQDTGTRLIGPVQCSKFVPFDIIRPDASDDILIEHSKKVDLTAYYAKYKAKILSLVGHRIPAQTPVPDDVVVGIGTTFDLDLVYNEDKNGSLRKRLDKHLGCQDGWTLLVHKATFTQTLYKIIDVACDSWTIKVRVSILKPYLEVENLSLTSDKQDYLLYQYK